VLKISPPHLDVLYGVIGFKYMYNFNFTCWLGVKLGSPFKGRKFFGGFFEIRELRGTKRKLYEAEANYTMRSLVICKHEVKSELGGACNTHERDEKFMMQFGLSVRKKKVTWTTQAYKIG
jgi:hypothetical protein